MGELLVCRAHQIPVVRIVLPADERIVLEHGSRFDEGGVADGDVLVLVEDRGILFRVLMEQATDGFRHGGPPVFGLVLFRSDPEMGVGGVGSHRLVIDLGEKDTHHVHGKVGIRVLHAPAVKTVMAHRQQSAHITGSFQLSYARSPPILPSLTAPRQTGGLLEDLNAVLVLSPVEDRAVTIRPDATIGAGVEDVRDQLGVSVLHLVPFAFDHEVDLALVTVQAGGLGRVDDDVRAHRVPVLVPELLRPMLDRHLPPDGVRRIMVLVDQGLDETLPDFFLGSAFKTPPPRISTMSPFSSKRTLNPVFDMHQPPCARWLQCTMTPPFPTVHDGKYPTGRGMAVDNMPEVKEKPALQ